MKRLDPSSNFPRPQPLEYDGWVGDFTPAFIVPGFSTSTPDQNGLGYSVAGGLTIEFQCQKVGSNSTTWGPHLIIENEIAVYIRFTHIIWRCFKD